jgi:excisionase family DNA binding protein
MTKKIDLSNPPNFDLYTIGDVAAILHVSRKSVSKWIKMNALPAIRLGPGQRLLRVHSDDLDAFIKEYRIKAPKVRIRGVEDDPMKWPIKPKEGVNNVVDDEY